MKTWEVDRKVGNVKNRKPDCIEPKSESSSDESGLST
jgi:hypothetical protein